MKSNKTSFQLVVLIGLSVICSAQPSLTGRWQGFHNGLPWVMVNVSQEHGKTGGTVTFFVLRRDSEGTPATGVAGKVELALKDAHWNNNVLRFEVIRPSDHQTLSFQMSLQKNGAALLQPTGLDGNPQSIELTRQK